MQYKIKDIPGTSGVEHILANVSHYSLYVFMTIMPLSGIAMGFYGGNLNSFLLLFVAFACATILFLVTHSLRHCNSRFLGKGLPFFNTTIPGIVKTEENKTSTGQIAKQVRADDELLRI